MIRDKSYKFALRIIKLYKYLVDNKEFVLSKQVLRSGTSVGANVEEAIGGQSDKDFVSKISIAYKEARESRYWLNLLVDGEFITIEHSKSLIDDCDELCKIMGKIIITCKEKNNS